MRLPEYSPALLSAINARLLPTAVLLMTCCGCPPAPPSQEEQRQATTSHWITVEIHNADGTAQACFNDDDLDAIRQTVPVVSAVVAERVRTGRIESDAADAATQVCATTPDYIQLLKEGARVQLQHGRFLESVDSQNDGNVIVLRKGLTETLFPNADPVGQTVVFESMKMKVIGVVTEGASWGKSLSYDAYVPVQLFGLSDDPDAGFLYERIRFRVERLDQVENAQAVIQEILTQRHPDRASSVRSFLSDVK